MSKTSNTTLFWWETLPRLLTAIALTLVGCLLPLQARARSTTMPYVVMNDRGGDVATRRHELSFVSTHDTRVEIRGDYCLSSCTMFLGAPEICIEPQTRFGFHGPSNQGAPLKPEQFEYWSGVIASYYPRHLAKWYMATARHLSGGYYFLTGAQLIQMGFPRC